MKRREVKGQSAFIYDDEGTRETSEQIVDAYNSGVLDPEKHQDEDSEGTEGWLS